MTPDGPFGLLSSVSCGAFVLATDQTVVYRNRRNREILGYRPDRVVGRRCSGIVPEVEGLTLTKDCEEGCLMLREPPGRHGPWPCQDSDAVLLGGVEVANCHAHGGVGCGG